jgi:flavin-dependent thymidylate synthase
MGQESSKEVARYADVAMYDAAPDTRANEGFTLKPKVTLISMTENPLRVMAAGAQLYAGEIIHYPTQISNETARRWFADMTKTKLQAPLEFVHLHFLIEGVTRAFTHQMVRQRTAVYVQESQRFAVKRNAKFEVAMPPSIAALKEDDPQRVIWDKAITQISRAYVSLVDSGIPAEDARGLLPTNITTRIHYATNLRNLADHAGMRLCSQAQYEWKQVWAGMLAAIRDYGPEEEAWQQYLIASLFKPVCYQTGKCEFMAETDRACAIRGRVMEHHAAGEGPDKWTDINSMEALFEGAARVRPGGEDG